MLDQTGPQLSRFILDKATRYLHLFFNEAVDKSSVVVPDFTLLAFVFLEIRKMTLTTERQVLSPNPAEVILDLQAKA